MPRNCSHCSAPLANSFAFGGGQRCRLCGNTSASESERSERAGRIDHQEDSEFEAEQRGVEPDSFQDLRLVALLENSRRPAEDAGDVESVAEAAVSPSGSDHAAETLNNVVSGDQPTDFRERFAELREQCRFMEMLQLAEENPEQVRDMGLASGLMEVRYLYSRQEAAWKSLGEQDPDSLIQLSDKEHYLALLDEMGLEDVDFLVAMKRFGGRHSDTRKSGQFGFRVPGFVLVGVSAVVVYLALPPLLESLQRNTQTVGPDSETSTQSVSEWTSEDETAVSAQHDGGPADDELAMPNAEGSDQDSGGLTLRQVESPGLQLAADALAGASGSEDSAGIARLAALGASASGDGGLSEQQLAALMSGIRSGDSDCTLLVPMIRTPGQFGLSSEDGLALQQAFEETGFQVMDDFQQGFGADSMAISCDVMAGLNAGCSQSPRLKDLQESFTSGVLSHVIRLAEAQDYDAAFDVLDEVEGRFGEQFPASVRSYVEALLITEAREEILGRRGQGAAVCLEKLGRRCPHRMTDVFNGLPSDVMER